VTNIELFFDLVYVFALIQLSHRLLDHPTWEDAWQTLLLLAAVWLVWVYTTWVTNYLDPERLPIRVLLLGLMLVSLVMSASIPTAFGAGGLVMASAFAIMQIGRTIFTLVAVRGTALQLTFERLLVWCVISGCIWLLGAMWPSPIRELLWALAIAVDLLGAAIGFYTPGLGQSRTLDWTIRGAHFAERCQAFVLIALGELFLIIGANLVSLGALTLLTLIAFLVDFVTSAALWWIYFDRSAEEGARQIAASRDPGRLGRSAYQFVHPIMIAGIIVIGAGDDAILAHPSAVGEAATGWMVLGGSILFLAGHALFKAVVWEAPPWPELAAIIALTLLGLSLRLFAPHLSALALGILTATVLVGVAATGRLQRPAVRADAHSAIQRRPRSTIRGTQ
jgi:low temperature requirement protein LtrA